MRSVTPPSSSAVPGGQVSQADVQNALSRAALACGANAVINFTLFYTSFPADLLDYYFAGNRRTLAGSGVLVRLAPAEDGDSFLGADGSSDQAQARGSDVPPGHLNIQLP